VWGGERRIGTTEKREREREREETRQYYKWMNERGEEAEGEKSFT